MATHGEQSKGCSAVARRMLKRLLYRLYECLPLTDILGAPPRRRGLQRRQKTMDLPHNA